MMFKGSRHGRRFVAAVAFLVLASLTNTASARGQDDLEGLRATLAKQYAEIEAQFAKLRAPRRPAPPAWTSAGSPPVPGVAAPQPGESGPHYYPGPPPSFVGTWNLAEWQAELSRRFGRAAATVEEMIKLYPPDADALRETLETLRLYAEPVSSPGARTVFGAKEVSRSARLSEAPPAEYTRAARDAKLKGDVRLRLVLAADGSVKHVFPIKTLGHGLTEAAVGAARRIRFETAERGGYPASQFVTLVYEFKGRHLSSAPYVPKTIF